MTVLDPLNLLGAALAVLSIYPLWFFGRESFRALAQMDGDRR